MFRMQTRQLESSVSHRHTHACCQLGRNCRTLWSCSQRSRVQASLKFHFTCVWLKMVWVVCGSRLQCNDTLAACRHRARLHSSGGAGPKASGLDILDGSGLLVQRSLKVCALDRAVGYLVACVSNLCWLLARTTRWGKGDTSTTVLPLLHSHT